MKAKVTEEAATPFATRTEGLEAFNTAVGQAAERGQAIVASSLATWQSEVARYFEHFSAHSQATLEALARCKGPMDVLAVEQEWLKSRGQAYMDSGMRFAQAFAHVAQTVTEAAAPTTQAKSVPLDPPAVG